MEKKVAEKTGSKKRRINRKYPLPATTLENDLLILSSFVKNSSGGDIPVSYMDIEIDKDIDNTVFSKELNFFSSIGLADEVSRGKYVPTPECINFVNKLDWDNEEEAKEVLRKLLGASWFGYFTIKLLRDQKQIDFDSLVKKLGEECKADKKRDKSAIKRLIKWLEYAEIIEIDENKIVRLKKIPELSKMEDESKEEALSTSKIEEVTSETMAEEEKMQLGENKKVRKEILVNLTINIQIDSNTDVEKVREIMKVIKQYLVGDDNE